VARLFNQREYDLFLSHAHADRAFVEDLYAWLTRSAGLKVFYDPDKGTAGTGISTLLQREIENCRGLLLIVSDASVESTWVEREYNIAVDEASEQPDFRIVPVRLGDAAGKKLLKGVSWFDISDRRFSARAAAAILRGMYVRPDLPDPARSRDVYVSASWRVDGQSAVAASRYLVEKGFRLIGDMKDQPAFDLDRIHRIMETCGAFVSILPFRDAERASAGDRPYKYFLQELDLAEAVVGLPSLVVADPRIRRADRDDSKWLRMPTAAEHVSPEVARRLDLLWDDWQRPRLGSHVFLALSQEMERAAGFPAVRDTIEMVTGMNSVVGFEIQGQEQPNEIQETIRRAALVVADITDDNVNVCIEAGMAKIAGRPYEMLCKGPTRSAPFMIRGPNILFYNDDLEMHGALHRIARTHRRRIINAELR
jgi:hypothetical protein